MVAEAEVIAPNHTSSAPSKAPSLIAEPLPFGDCCPALYAHPPSSTEEESREDRSAADRVDFMTRFWSRHKPSCRISCGLRPPRKGRGIKQPPSARASARPGRDPGSRDDPQCRTLRRRRRESPNATLQ